MNTNPITVIRHIFAAGLVLGSAFTGVAATLDAATYQVNMSVQMALGNFNPANGDMVYVSGNWDNWSTTNLMSASSDTNIYTLTLQQANGTWPTYKFFINPGGSSSGSALVWESFSTNRWFALTTSTTNLPVVYFNNVTEVPAYEVKVTFQLSMKAPIIQGLFSIGSSTVYAYGSFSNWTSGTGVLLTNVPGTSNYIGTLITTLLETNTMVYYKYAINGSGGTWEGNVGTSGAANRSFVLVSTNQALSLDYWNNITNATASYAVMFQADMLVEYALGNFDPVNNGDTVYVNGDWDWSGDALQLVESASPYVYTGTVALAYSPGTIINYKYALNGGINASDWENSDVGPGSGANRQFVLSVTNLPADYFDNYTNLGQVNISGSGSQTALSWASGTNANNHIRLQNSTNLVSGWSDVANTQGQSGVTNDFGGGPQFFRLIGP
jgi:hypothetical protein